MQLFQKQGLKGYCHMFVDFWVKFRPKSPRRWPSPRIAMLSRTFLPSLPRTPMANGVHDFTCCILLSNSLGFFLLGYVYLIHVSWDPWDPDILDTWRFPDRTWAWTVLHESNTAMLKDKVGKAHNKYSMTYEYLWQILKQRKWETKWRKQFSILVKVNPQGDTTSN